MVQNQCSLFCPALEQQYGILVSGMSLNYPWLAGTLTASGTTSPEDYRTAGSFNDESRVSNAVVSRSHPSGQEVLAQQPWERQGHVQQYHGVTQELHVEPLSINSSVPTVSASPPCISNPELGMEVDRALDTQSDPGCRSAIQHRNHSRGIFQSKFKFGFPTTI